MRIEITIDKLKPLPAGAIEALTGELNKRIGQHFSDAPVSVRYAGSNSLSVLGGAKEDKELIGEILQETWESAEDWFITD